MCIVVCPFDRLCSWWIPRYFLLPFLGLLKMELTEVVDLSIFLQFILYSYLFMYACMYVCMYFFFIYCMFHY
jgi:hypothetical protein